MAKINPFHELYVTETIPPKDFVNLFSPYLVESATALFKPGNVILKGVQGSGKSMLLNLLKTEIRFAYLETGQSLPLPLDCIKFIGAGINILRSGALNFGQRPIKSDESRDLQEMPIYFGDFVNYWIVGDLLKSVEMIFNKLKKNNYDNLGIYVDGSQLDKVARSLAADECWFGYLDGVNDYMSLIRRISERIQEYRLFMNYNIEKLSSEISHSKTSIGEPISKTAKYLWEKRVVSADVPFYIRIDQYEGLHHIEGWGKEFGLQFQRVLNKALGTRDPKVSYRIGVRRYGWRSDLYLHGTTSQFESERDYKIVDIDEILRRQENMRTWEFPGFAKDVFDRRVKHAGYHMGGAKGYLLKYVMKRDPSPEEKAKKYAGVSPQRSIKIRDDWPEKWSDLLKEVAAQNPLSARLGEAWIRQQKRTLPYEPPEDPLPWEKSGKRYWRKERISQALMQIAGRCGERMIWAGEDSILALSGGNILVFVSLCQHIWDAWIQSTRDIEERNNRDTKAPIIDEPIQAIGIQTASTYWFEKVPEQPGGNRRQRFIGYIGAMFHKLILEDLAMSYPGHNGFSLRRDELELDKTVHKFLQDAVDYGDLYDSPHTTKTKDKKPRIKWYLKPIFSPYFKIPEQHTKEPMYINVKQARKWLMEANAISGEKRQLSLFPRRQRGED